MINDIRGFFKNHGLILDPSIDEFRPQQDEALEWALSHSEPYLLVNAPTGSGKTLLLGAYGCSMGGKWTYSVSTKALQDQVARTFEGLPVMKGRGNFECPISLELFYRQLTADQAPCAADQWCPHTGRSGPDGELAEEECGYYKQRLVAIEADYRCTNYAMLLSYPPLIHGSTRTRLTNTLLADEAHNIEDAVCNFWSMYFSSRTLERFGLIAPQSVDVERWVAWAAQSMALLPPVKKPAAVGSGEKPDFGLVTLRKNLDQVIMFGALSPGNWLIEHDAKGVKWSPIWGRGLVVPELLQPIGKALMASATLMGAEFIADTLGLQDGSWAYLDLPSTFPPSIRPINYSPVCKMNAAAMTPGYNEQRAKMQTAIDKLIDYYVGQGVISGLIHAVSNKYRDFILTESRWSFMMTTDAVEHERKVLEGEASVLVTASHTEGWDGKDELCRFIIMPKIPFPNLGDRRTKIRQEEDARSYDHKALVAIVQGAGRGVRHMDDQCDTWILDESWRFLYGKRKDWLPESFHDAYQRVNIT